MVDKELELEFYNIINSYMIQIDHTIIISSLAIKYLYDFPDKLPKEISEAIKTDKEIVLKELENSGNLIHKFKSGYDSVLYMAQNPAEIRVGDLSESISFPIVKLIKSKRDYDVLTNKTNEAFFDFEYSINAQALLMYNAILEGFLKQIIELILKIETSIKKRRIKKSLEKRLEFLEIDCGISKLDNPNFLNILKSLEQLRHIIVHNNGIADHTFVNNTGIFKQKIGERVKLHEKMQSIIGFTISAFVIDLTQKIAEKYFGNK